MPPTDRILMLSNQELAEELRRYGVSVGPIVQSTRSLYEKKLRNLLLGEVSQPKYEEVSDDDEEEEEEEEDQEEIVPVQVSKQTRTEPRQRVPTKVTPSRVNRPKQTEFPEEMSTRSQASDLLDSRKGKAKKGFPIWTLLFILVILAGLGYLIVKNMEPNAENSIPNQIDAQV